MRGGSPPRERRVSMAMIVNRGDLADEMARELIFVVLLILRRRNKDEVIIR